ncbi:MAG: alpha/beta hydrolase [Pseudomonadota bacterium]
MESEPMIIYLLFALLAATLAFPFVAEALRPRMTATRRKLAPGQFANLSQGITHYQWTGPEDGPVAVCVHGLTTPSFVYGPFAEGLAAKGYRVLTYDLYGRGFSDRPKGEQDSAFFNRQLNDLLADQGVTEPFVLVGYSMGGAIGAGFAAAHLTRVKQLILLAPAGMALDLGPLVDMAQRGTFMGTWMTLGFYPKSLRRATEGERGLESPIPHMVDRQIEETRLKGFAPAVLSSLRGVLDEDLEPAHRAVAAAGIPVTAIWGETDEVIPLECKDRLSDWNPAAQNHVIAGAGHTVTYTHTDEVLKALNKTL